MNRPGARRIKQLAAEITARHLDDILSDQTVDIASAHHVAGLNPDEIVALRNALERVRTKLRADAGDIADLSNRQISVLWSAP